MEMTALVNRWKKLASTGAEEAGSAHMLHMVAAVEDRKKPTMPLVHPTSPSLYRRVPQQVTPQQVAPQQVAPQQVAPQQQQQQQQVVVAPQQQVLQRPPSSFSPYEPNASLGSLGSYMVDQLPPNFSFSNLPSGSISTPVRPHSAQSTLTTPQK